MSSTEPNVRNKRKRKKSFLKNARKYAKQGHYGRGSHLDADTYQYFVRIMEAYREGFDSEEDKLNFVNNVFEQTENEEVNCCKNQVGCRVIETLLPFANAGVLERFIEAFSSELRPLCSDCYASHVLEALVTKSCHMSLDTKQPDNIREKFKNFTLKLSKFLLNNLEDYMWDKYGNHIFRTCIEQLAQIPKEEKSTQKKKVVAAKEVPVSDLPEEYIEVIKDCGERLLTWPQFAELCNSELTSGFLQVLLRALHKTNHKLMKKYIKKFLENYFSVGENSDVEPDSNRIPKVFFSVPQMMLLEASIQVANAKLFTQIYCTCFKGRLQKLALTRATNFAVQKLLTNCNEKADFESMFDELADHFKEIIQEGHTGVILALAQSCKRLLAKQGNFVQNLMKSLDCLEPEDRQNVFILCLARFKPYDEVVKMSNENLQKEKLNLHGTLILQLLLEFNKPIKIVNSLLEMETNDLKNLFSNTMGSHIVDSYVTSQYIGEKSREKLVRKMKGTYQELAATKYGSRSFEAIWKAAGSKHKISIMEELAYKDAAWANSEHGKIIASKVNLSLFKRNKEDWKNSLNKIDTKDLFADVLQ